MHMITMADSTATTADEGVKGVTEETEEVVSTNPEKQMEPEKETTEEETPGEVAGAPAAVVSEDTTGEEPQASAAPAEEGPPPSDPSLGTAAPPQAEVPQVAAPAEEGPLPSDPRLDTAAPPQAEEPQVAVPAEEGPPPSDPRLATAAPPQPEDSTVVEEKKEIEAIAAIPRKEKPVAVDTAIAASASSLYATASHEETPTATDSAAPSVSFHDYSALTSRPGRPGPLFGLNEGVRVPNSIDSSLLEGRILDSLNQLPVSLVNDALIEYDDAINNKGGQIRSRGAYLMGVIKVRKRKTITE
jgi:hypothetical protein